MSVSDYAATLEGYQKQGKGSKALWVRVDT